MSLADRRKRLEAYTAAFDEAQSLAPPHLEAVNRARGNIEGAQFAETNSIENCDLSGGKIDDDEWYHQRSTDEWGNDESGDLFVAFLRRMVATNGLKGVDSIGGTADNLSYDVFTDALEHITNGDERAEFALLHRHARIREIPEDLRGVGRATERAAWLAGKVPEGAWKAQEALWSDIESSLDNAVEAIKIKLMGGVQNA